jgi:hypothetical protein
LANERQGFQAFGVRHYADVLVIHPPDEGIFAIPFNHAAIVGKQDHVGQFTGTSIFIYWQANARRLTVSIPDRQSL